MSNKIVGFSMRAVKEDGFDSYRKFYYRRLGRQTKLTVRYRLGRRAVKGFLANERHFGLGFGGKRGVRSRNRSIVQQVEIRSERRIDEHLVLSAFSEVSLRFSAYFLHLGSVEVYYRHVRDGETLNPKCTSSVGLPWQPNLLRGRQEGIEHPLCCNQDGPR